jgi:hypothetical protein
MAVSRDPAALAELNAETVLILGDVERCLALAIIAEPAQGLTPL